MDANSYLAKDIAGLEVGIDYATLGAATVAPAVQALIDVVSAESAVESETERVMLDGMLPSARNMLVAHLTALKTALGTYTPA